jgi:hypothetical protein
MVQCKNGFDYKKAQQQERKAAMHKSATLTDWRPHLRHRNTRGWLVAHPCRKG